MKAEMNFDNIGGAEPFYDYTLVENTIQAHADRATNVKGGYFVKNGWCFIDVSFDSLFNSAGNSGYLKGFPTSTGGSSYTGYFGSNTGTKWQVQTASGVTYLASTDTVTKSEDKLHIIGAYPTSASDTV